MKKTKVAVIGVGNMGENHARVYSDIADLVAIAEINEDLGRAIAKKYNTKFYKSYKQMLQNEELEAISVAVPTMFHKKVVLECLREDLPTLVEKPIATNLSDAKKMQEYA